MKQFALQWFTAYRIRTIDAVILTHGHADAMMGLDDLRQWTLGGPNVTKAQEFIPIYLDSSTMEVVQRVYPYAVDTAFATGGGAVPSLKFHVFDSGKTDEFLMDSFFIEELEVFPFRVEHGKFGPEQSIYYSLGFRFEDITYISDTNSIPESSYELIAGSNLLVLDALKDEPHQSHFSISQALDALIRIAPKLAFLTGFSHDLLHEEINSIVSNDTRLLENGITAQAGYDGLRIPWPFKNESKI
ncbi:hypothetical protein HK096_010686 [Nowakowskiella sp. JEL0078]|nr:hypothetical protein HK096_010686 [Nowakowskiella sp. JEL0078]